MFDGACRGEEVRGNQNEENVFTKPVDERKDKDTMDQIIFLRKYVDVLAEDREYYDTIIQSEFLINPAEKRKGKDRIDQLFF